MPSPPKIHPVILSGGAGTRLWPLSRENRPKQFLPLADDETLLQQAALRMLDPQFTPLTVIASLQHRFLVAEQLRQVGVTSPTIVLEPSARNTAAATAIAALLVRRRDPEGLVLLAPADHRILDSEAFRSAVREAATAAREGFLLLFGVKPDHPATGYGYIRVGEPLAAEGGQARSVDAFVEKPDRSTAERYLASGDYLWNSGIFLLPAKAILAELSNHEPELMANAEEALERASRDEDFLRLDRPAFDRCRSVSIDYAVIERAERLAVIPVDFGWTDIGSWSALAEIAGRDAAGNTLVGEVLTEATRNSYVRSDGPLVATVGVEDMVIVATPDAVLVARKDRDQDVKRIVDRLRDGGRGRI